MIPNYVLLRIYLTERNSEALRCIREVARAADVIEAAIFTDWTTHYSREQQLLDSLKHRFNLLELRVVGQLLSENATEINIRYRPSPISHTWIDISSANEAQINSIVSEEERRNFSLWLNLSKFSSVKSDVSVRETAVLEILSPIARGGTAHEDSIEMVIRQVCPKLLEIPFWGYADVLPMRDLSIEEEWFVARTDVFWLDLAATVDAEHQYLIKSSTGAPKIELPRRRTFDNGKLSIYSYGQT